MACQGGCPEEAGGPGRQHGPHLLDGGDAGLGQNYARSRLYEAFTVYLLHCQPSCNSYRIINHSKFPVGTGEDSGLLWSPELCSLGPRQASRAFVELE